MKVDKETFVKKIVIATENGFLWKLKKYAHVNCLRFKSTCLKKILLNSKIIQFIFAGLFPLNTVDTAGKVSTPQNILEQMLKCRIYV